MNMNLNLTATPSPLYARVLEPLPNFGGAVRRGSHYSTTPLSVGSVVSSAEVYLLTLDVVWCRLSSPVGMLAIDSE